MGRSWWVATGAPPSRFSLARPCGLALSSASEEAVFPCCPSTQDRQSFPPARVNPLQVTTETWASERAFSRLAAPHEGSGGTRAVIDRDMLSLIRGCVRHGEGSDCEALRVTYCGNSPAEGRLPWWFFS